MALVGDAPPDLFSVDQLLEELRRSLLFEKPWVWIDRIEDRTNLPLDPPAPASSPLLAALGVRNESMDNDDVRDMVATSASDEFLTAAVGNYTRDDLLQIAQDAHKTAVERLTPVRGDSV
ncbi:MAG: hypothetical protein O3C10_11975 [Chloroflexi bacterium]|nr:hypothetical protein [Chloroflexota bacterium]